MLMFTTCVLVPVLENLPSNMIWEKVKIQLKHVKDFLDEKIYNRGKKVTGQLLKKDK